MTARGKSELSVAEVSEAVDWVLTKIGSLGSTDFTAHHVGVHMRQLLGHDISPRRIAHALREHPRVGRYENGYYRLGKAIPPGHAVISVYPCGCLNGADSQPTQQSILDAQHGDCHAEIVAMAEAKHRMDTSWGHRTDCPERERRKRR